MLLDYVQLLVKCLLFMCLASLGRNVIYVATRMADFAPSNSKHTSGEN